MMHLIYLASPYNHPDKAVTQSRYEAVLAATFQLMKEGHHVFSPIVHNHWIVVNYGITGWDKWKEYDTLILSRCDELKVLTLDGWNMSQGVREESNFAHNNNIPVTYMHPNVQVGMPVARKGLFEPRGGIF